MNNQNNSNTPKPDYSIFGSHVNSMVDAWHNAVQYGYPAEITKHNGGITLDNLFGPIANRVPISSLSTNLNDYHRKKEAILKYKSSDGRISNGKLHIENIKIAEINEVFKLVIRAFSEIIDPDTTKNILYGYQLKALDLRDFTISGIPFLSDHIVLNMEVQRDPSLLRIFELLVDFDSSLVFGATGRASLQTQKIYCNDGQHGALALLFHGVLTIPVVTTFIDTEYMDHNQFIGKNLDVYPLSVYDVHKVLVNRAKSFLKAGLTINARDLPSYNLDLVLNNCNVKLVHESVTPTAGESNSTAQFQKHFKNYCNSMYANREIFETAMLITRQAWPSFPVMHEPIWGLIELLNRQPVAVIKQTSFIVSMSEILSAKWSTPNAVWKEVNAQIKKQYPIKVRDPNTNTDVYTEFKDHRFTNTGNRGLMIGSAIKSLVDNYETWAQQHPDDALSFGIILTGIKNSGGQVFEMDMPFTSATLRHPFSIFKPTV